jgi:hypothetical protein
VEEVIAAAAGRMRCAVAGERAGRLALTGTYSYGMWFALAAARESIFESARAIITNSGIPMPSNEASSRVYDAFARGVPYDDSASLGDLVNAGWRVFRAGDQQLHANQGHTLIEYTSDLILKSAEIHEIRRLLQ